MDLDKDSALAMLISESFVNTCKEHNIPEHVSLRAAQALFISYCELMKLDRVMFRRVCLNLIEVYEDVYDELQ
jgi:hypothetical protein